MEGRRQKAEGKGLPFAFCLLLRFFSSSQWRPSRWAHRIGGVAIDLDTLLTRDGRRLLGLLKIAYRQLSPADRDLLRLRFVRNLPVVTIARLLGVPARRLYARIDGVVLSMRPAITEGLSAR